MARASTGPARNCHAANKISPKRSLSIAPSGVNQRFWAGQPLRRRVSHGQELRTIPRAATRLAHGTPCRVISTRSPCLLCRLDADRLCVIRLGPKTLFQISQGLHTVCGLPSLLPKPQGWPAARMGTKMRMTKIGEIWTSGSEQCRSGAEVRRTHRAGGSGLNGSLAVSQFRLVLLIRYAAFRGFCLPSAPKLARTLLLLPQFAYTAIAMTAAPNIIHGTMMFISTNLSIFNSELDSVNYQPKADK